MRRTLFVLTLLAAALIVLAACGGGSQPAAAPAQPTVAPTQPPVAVGDAAKGKELFAGTCAACHGPAGEGVTGLGKPFTTSDFVPSQSDAELLAFLKVGRPTSDPANTTGVDMPPKGGNPALNDEQLMDIIAYIRTLHQ
ncbi:MAG: cytochrome c [Caldilineales bacterium]